MIWAAWLTHAVAWFLPVATVGTTFPDGLPGWQAFRVASCAVWSCGDSKFEHWYNAVFATISATTTLLFILGSVWVVWFGSRTVRRAWGKLGTKNDRNDARELAEMLYRNKLEPVYHSEYVLRTLRGLARSYITITRDRDPLAQELPVLTDLELLTVETLRTQTILTP